MEKETKPKAKKEVVAKKETEKKPRVKKEVKDKSELISVFDKKSNRPRFLTQEEIDLEVTRYSLR